MSWSYPLTFALLIATAAAVAAPPETAMLHAERLASSPIVTPDMAPDLKDNINGPSLIRVPSWIDNPLGTYYLYFAHHAGTYIRLAYADALDGPWQLYEPGTLQLDRSYCERHIASPDVLVDDERQEIWMYYHGPVAREEQDACLNAMFPIVAGQRTKVAVSKDGLHFEARPQVLGAPYFRVMRHHGRYYALGMPGIWHVSDDGLGDFRMGPAAFTRHQRHTALLARGDTLYVFYSNAFDCPERILCATADISSENPRHWHESEPFTVLTPEMPYEGADEPLVPSRRGVSYEPVRQLRDPAIYVEGDAVYLLYSVAGERGIGIARLSGFPE